MATNPPSTTEPKAPVRKRRGFPVVPTIMVAIALPILIGFGFWQLQRAEWKEALLVELAANSNAPLLVIDTNPIPDNAQFRRVRLFMECDAGEPVIRAGRNLAGKTGYSHLASCRGGGVPVLLDYGWSARPDTMSVAPDSGVVEGIMVRNADGGWLMVDSAAAPPLTPSAPPSLDTISNNHLSYAIQWFSFAAILAIIYALYLRRWNLAPMPSAA